MPSLRELEIKGNPCSTRHEYKYDLLWQNFLERLDGVEIEEKDYLLAKAFHEAGINSRPGTAPDNNDNKQ